MTVSGWRRYVITVVQARPGPSLLQRSLITSGLVGRQGRPKVGNTQSVLDGELDDFIAATLKQGV